MGGDDLGEDDPVLNGIPDSAEIDDEEEGGPIDFDNLGWGDGGGSASASGPEFVGYGQVYDYAKATAERVPMIAAELLEQGKAVQLKIQRIAAGGALEEVGKLHNRAALEDIIDMTGGLHGTFIVQPIDSMGQPVGDPEPKRISERHPYLREVAAAFAPSGGGGGITPERVVELQQEARKEARADTVSMLEIHAQREDSLRKHGDRVADRADNLTEKMAAREDNMALERAKLGQASSKDQAGMIAGIFQSMQEQNRASAEAAAQAAERNQTTMMAMFATMNQPKQSFMEQIMSTPMGMAFAMKMLDRFMPDGGGEANPMDDMMKVAQFLKAMNPDTPQPTFADKVQEMTALKGLLGGDGKSDMVQMAELATATIGDAIGAIVPAITGPTESKPKSQPKTVNPKSKPKPEAAAAPPSSEIRGLKLSALKLCVALDTEPDADAARIIELIEGQFHGPIPAGFDLAAELLSAGLPAEQAEAVTAAMINKKES